MEEQKSSKEPLLSESENWSSYQYVGRTGSVIPTASLAEPHASVEEIRSAAVTSDYYPPSIHAGLITSPDLDPHPAGHPIFHQGAYGTTSPVQGYTPGYPKGRMLDSSQP